MSLAKLSIDLVANLGSFEADSGKAAQIIARDSEKMTRAQASFLKSIERTSERLGAVGTDFLRVKAAEVGVSDQAAKFIDRMDAIGGASARVAAQSGAAFSAIAAGVDGAITKQGTAVEQLIAGIKAVSAEAARLTSVATGEEGAGTITTDTLKVRLANITAGRANAIAQLKDAATQQQAAEALAATERAAADARIAAARRIVDAQNGLTASYREQLTALRALRDAGALTPAQFKQAGTDLVAKQPVVKANNEAQAAQDAAARAAAALSLSQAQVGASTAYAAAQSQVYAAFLLAEAAAGEQAAQAAARQANVSAAVAAASERARAAQQSEYATKTAYIAKVNEEAAALFRTRDAQLALDAERAGVSSQQAAQLAKFAGDREFISTIYDQIAAEQKLADQFGKTAAEILRQEAAARGLTNTTASAIGRFETLANANKKATDFAAEAKGNDAFIASIEREVGALGKTRSELIAQEAAQRGLTDALAPTIARLREFESASDKYGRSALAARNQVGLNVLQLQTLKYTISDVAASLGSGISPFTILLQQGGQVAQIEGGVTGIVRGIVQSITPFRLALAGSGVALTALGYAFLEGSKQSKAFNDAVVLSGNFAGQTQGQFTALARSVAASGQVTVGAARDFAQALLSTGQVGPRIFGAATEAAAKYGQATGKNAQEVATDFASMADDVARWAASHNKSLNFLSAAQYDQIKLLQDQGRAAEAQGLVYDALNARFSRLQGNLGYLDKILQGSKNLWSSFWDAAFDVGRSVTIEDKIAAAAKAVDAINLRQSAGRSALPAFSSAPPLRPQDQPDDAARLAVQGAKKTAELIGLERQKLRQDDNAFADADRADTNKQAIAFKSVLEGVLTKAKTQGEYLKKVAELQRGFIISKEAGTPVSAADQKAALEQVKKDFTDKPAESEGNQVLKARLDQALKALQDELQGERDAYAFHAQYVKGVYDAGGLSLKQFYDDRRATQAAGLASELEVLDKEIAAEEAFIKASKDPSDKVGAQTKINDLRAEQAQLQTEGARATVLADQEETASFKALSDRVIEYRAQLLQLTGDEEAAAKVRGDAAIAAARLFARQTEQSASPITEDDIALQERAIDAANKFAEVQRRLGTVNAQAANAEESFLLRSEQSGLSLRDTEAGLYAIRATSLVQLGELRDKADALAAASTDPKIIQAAKDLGLAYAKAAENIDPAINRLRDAGKDLGSSLAGTFTDALEKGGRFKDLLNGIGNDFRKVIDKAFIQEPLEKFLQGTIRDFTEGSGVVADFIRAGGTGKSDNAKKGLGIDAAGKGFNAAKDGATADATAAQVQAVTTSTNAITSLSAAAQSAATALNRITGPDIVPAGVAAAGGGDTTPLIIDRSGVGINAAGYSAAKDGATGSTDEVSTKLLDSQTALTTANLASEAATIASAAGFREAGSAIRVMATTAQLASQALALIQTTSTTSAASSSGGGILGALAGLFGGSGGGSSAAVAGNDIALAFAKGGAFDRHGMEAIEPFAAGGVFNTPHLFKFANGGQMSTGVLGEAGPEAILPLKRGPNGALGVSAAGMGGRVAPSVVQQISITVQVQAQQGMSRATAMQQGADVGRGIQRALARNG